MFGLSEKIATYVTGGLLAVIVGLALALTITRTTLHKRTDALHAEQQAHATDIATWKAATAKAQAEDAAHARQVEQQQAQIAQDTEHDLQTQLADARAIADRWMRDHAATDDHSGSGNAPVSEPADTTRNANLASAQALVSGADIDACATDYVIAKGWQDWWSKVQPVWSAGTQ
jgi:hypothetical protein